jgi:uncharacterized protein (DUF2147 family)
MRTDRDDLSLICESRVRRHPKIRRAGCAHQLSLRHKGGQVAGRIMTTRRNTNLQLKLCLVAVALLLGGQASSADPQTVAGVWKQIDPDTGKVGALVTFTETGGVFKGAFSKLYLDPGDDPNPLCRKCPGNQRGKPLLGLVFIDGMRRSGLKYDGGTILDPETGTSYSANMKLSPDGNTLTVHGYVGLPLFGQSQTWKRVE